MNDLKELNDGDVVVLEMSNPEGLNEHGLYTYPITYTADLPEVTESSFTIVLKIYCRANMVDRLSAHGS